MELAKTLALSAVGGMVVGFAAGCSGDGKTAETPTTDSSATPAATEGAEKACCKNKNACKEKGGCKVEGANECAGKNECKEKGGCSKRDCNAT